MSFKFLIVSIDREETGKNPWFANKLFINFRFQLYQREWQTLGKLTPIRSRTDLITTLMIGPLPMSVQPLVSLAMMALYGE